MSAAGRHDVHIDREDHLAVFGVDDLQSELRKAAAVEDLMAYQEVCLVT